jgi:cystathionine beta-lyase/cystathionine gamma-synthase
MLRLSVGLEDVDDLIEDLAHGLDQMARRPPSLVASA